MSGGGSADVYKDLGSVSSRKKVKIEKWPRATNCQATKDEADCVDGGRLASSAEKQIICNEKSIFMDENSEVKERNLVGGGNQGTR
jgi:hypothetical protein